MIRINYLKKGRKDLDLIKPLWEKLNNYHGVNSPNFTQEYEDRSFVVRKKFLLSKSKDGALKMDLAYDQKKLVGYCISTITPDKEGEIDSLFVEKGYRSNGIGNELMIKALGWMEKKGAKNKIITMAVGNEEALSFYRKHGFLPRSIILEQKK